MEERENQTMNALHHNIMSFLSSRYPTQFSAGNLYAHQDIGGSLEEVKDACATLAREGKISGHNLHGGITYYAKEPV